MPIISQQKKDKISEQILHYLFENSPESKFTSDIAKEIARDEEFIKLILIELSKKGIVNLITKNSSGVLYLKRQRWRLSNQAFQIYSAAQSNKNQNAVFQNNNIYNNSDDS